MKLKSRIPNFLCISIFDVATIYIICSVLGHKVSEIPIRDYIYLAVIISVHGLLSNFIYEND